MFSCYTKIAKVEGNLKGATLTWEWEWSGTEHGIASPNVFPLRDSVIVTNKAIGAMQEVPPNSGVLTLTPVISCDESTLELEPIVLTVGLDFVEPAGPCCPGMMNPDDCPPCPDSPEAEEKTAQVHLFLRQPDGTTWTHLGNTGSLPSGRPLYLAYGVQRKSDIYWLSVNELYDYDIPGAGRSFPPSQITTGFIDTPDGVVSPGPSIPVGWIYWNSTGPLIVIPADDTVLGARFD